MKSFELVVWLRIFSLAFAAFVFNTSEFAPVGLLTDIGDSFSMSSASVGLMMTIYAWVVALMSLPCMLLTGKMERRKLLLWVFAVFILSHLLSSIAWSYPVLILSRIGVALSHAVFWSITAAIAIRIAPPGKKSFALSMLALGSTLATILGLPIGRIISQYLGWRMTFLVIGMAALLTLFFIYRFLPKLNSENGGTLASVPQLLKRPELVGIYVVLVLIVTAHFTAYSYIEPFIATVASMTDSFATTVLFVFGIAGLIASVSFARLNSRFGQQLPAIGIFGVTCCTALLLPLSGRPETLVLVCVGWAIAMTVIGLSLQLRVLEFAHDATDVAMAMFSGIFNIGIGAGALLGSQVSVHMGMTHIGEVAALVAAMALICCGIISWHVRRSWVRP